MCVRAWREVAWQPLPAAACVRAPGVSQRQGSTPGKLRPGPGCPAPALLLFAMPLGMTGASSTLSPGLLSGVPPASVLLGALTDPWLHHLGHPWGDLLLLGTSWV